MPKYTWTAKNKSGQTVVKEITANTSGEAQAILLADGFSDLKFMEDEIMSVARAGFTERSKIFGEEIKQPTADDRLKAMENPTVTFLDVIKKGIWQSKGLSWEYKFSDSVDCWLDCLAGILDLRRLAIGLLQEIDSRCGLEPLERSFVFGGHVENNWPNRFDQSAGIGIDAIPRKSVCRDGQASRRSG